MKKLIFALILSIFIHILFLMSVHIKKADTFADNRSKIKKNSSTIRYVKLKQEPKKVVKKDNLKKEVKKEVKKELEKDILEKQKLKQSLKKVKEVTDAKKRESVKEAKKTFTKPKTSQDVKPTFTKNLPKKTSKKVQKEQPKEKSLSDFLLTPELHRDMLDDITKSYIELYGEEYNSFNKVQKIFLQKNLKDIGRITQRYLRYPALAARLKQDGTNVVEFMLYPNGDISHLKLTSSSYSSSLDENTVETIRIAYKDYPRPEEPTKIKIYVNYFLY